MIRKLHAFFFENGNAEQTVAKNTAWLTISQFGARLIRAAFMVYLARLVGAEGYGIISYALSLAALVSGLTDLGISGVITRESAKNKADEFRYLATGAAAKFGLIGIGTLALVIAALVGLPQAMLLPFVILIVAFDGVRDLVTALFRAQERMEVEAYVQLSTNAAIVALGLVAAILVGNPAWVLGGYAVGCAIGAAVALLPLRKSIRSLRSRYDRSLIRPLVRSSWTFGIVGLIGSIMLNTDAIILALFRPEIEVGYYAAAQRVAQLVYVLPLPVASALFPLVSRLAGDAKAFKAVVESATRFLLVIGTGAAISLLIASGSVIRLLYGSAYEGSTMSLAILSLTLIPTFLVSSLSNALFALRKEKALIGYAAIAVCANIIANLILIPRFGGPGSALATLIAQTALLGYLAIVLKRTADISLLRKLPEIGIALVVAIVVAIVLVVAGVGGILAGFLTGVTYILVLFALGDETVAQAIGYVRKIRNVTS